jgi:peptidoglycan/LPS O-acetylase OafA/YrhL
MAVVFFFVLGGFSMTLGYKDKVLKTDFSYTQYLTKRCIKFYPLHWLCLFGVVPLALVSFEVHQIPIFIANATLLQSWIPIQKVYFSFNWVSWYLADTIFFAVMFPLLFKLIARMSTRIRAAIAVLLATIYATVAILLPGDKYHAVLYISPYMRLFDFILGIYLALLFMKIKEQPTKWRYGNVIGQFGIFALILLLVIESCLLPEDATLFAPVYWIPVALLILLASLVGRTGGGILLENKYIYRLGELSFIVFMTHQIVLRYAKIIFKLLHFENTIVYISITLVLTILISLVVERYFMKPVTQWLTNKNKLSMTARS